MWRGFSLAVAGSAALLGCSVLFPTELQRAAADAERFPFVVETYHHPDGLADPEFIEVIVNGATTEEEATQLWCEALVPHGADDTNALVYADPGPSYLRPECTATPPP